MEAEQLAKAYEPQRRRARWYPFWEKSGFFTADPASHKPRFAIMIPPPNVTGLAPHRPRLHADAAGRDRPLEADERVRHAVAARARPRRHRDADGGGAAAREGRQAQGGPRARGVRARVWAWKERAAARSSSSSGVWAYSLRLDARALHAWTPGCRARCARSSSGSTSRGSIYRGVYIVNWCPRCETALSRPRGGDGDGARQPLAHPLCRAGTASRASSWPPRGRRRCSATRRWPSTPTTSGTGTSSARR